MVVPADLKEFGLVPPSSANVRRRLILTTDGETGSGKSDFIFRTAPKPLLHMNLDNNIEPIEDRYVDDDILIKHVKMPVEIDMEKDLEQFRQLRSLYRKSVRGMMFRTYFIDTGEKLWELVRRGYLGGVGFGAAEQKDYDTPNAQMRSFFQIAKEHRVNFVMSHHVKEEFKAGRNAQTGKKTRGEATGRMVLEGWKHAMEESHCHVSFTIDREWDKTDRKDDVEVTWDTEDYRNKFTMTVMKCSANARVIGQVFRGEEISFPNLGTTVYPASKWKEWE